MSDHDEPPLATTYESRPGCPSYSQHPWYRSCVYLFLVDGDRLRIGYTDNSRQRLRVRENEGGVCLGLILMSQGAARPFEQELHREFDAFRIRKTELFRFDQSIVDRFTSHPDFSLT